MPHRLFWNDESGFPFIIGRKFTISRDGIVDVSLSFDIAGNDSVCMTAYQKFTFITGGAMQTVTTGDTVTLPKGKDVFIVSTCDPHHMHKFCVSNDSLEKAKDLASKLELALVGEAQAAPATLAAPGRVPQTQASQGV